MTPAQQDTLATVISAIGRADFAATTADALRRLMGFDLTTAILHRRETNPALLFDNFSDRQGVENYLRFTHRVNPILNGSGGAGVFRARDFAVHAATVEHDLAPYLATADEELGFRTVGWPQRLEEVGLYVDAYGGVVELSFYRPRARRAFARMAELETLRAPLAAAFNRHMDLARGLPVFATMRLSPRERDVADLLLDGCSSDAIALRLGISRYTVKDHRKQIFRKLGLGSLAELFALARGAYN